MEAILDAWLERVWRSYPPESARFLSGEKDRFRNPAGHAFRAGLAAILEEIQGGMDRARLRAALDSLLRIRAVQDFSASEALAFLPALKAVLREQSQPAEYDERIDEVLFIAFDSYVACREMMYRIRLEESRRRDFVAGRMARRIGTQ